MEAGGVHACVSMSACEPKIKEQPRGDPAAAVAEGIWLAGNAKPPNRVESGRPWHWEPPTHPDLGAAMGSGAPATWGLVQPSSWRLSALSLPNTFPNFQALPQSCPRPPHPPSPPPHLLLPPVQRAQWLFPSFLLTLHIKMVQ